MMTTVQETNGKRAEQKAEPLDVDVDVLDPVGRTVRFLGREVEVRPMTVGQIPAVTRALRGIAITGTDAQSIMLLVGEHGEQILRAASLATRLPLVEIEEAQLPEFIELFGAIVEVNAAFFLQAVTHLTATLAAFGGGLTSSTGSSTQDTASTG